jgi:5S rRNA maturation endonuclease (ribonuclease M5)
MEYVTVEGVIQRTGHHNKSDWYLLDIKEKLDNAGDYLWKKYQGSTDAKDTVITVNMTLDDSLFNCRVRNTNNKNFPVFQDLDLILNFNMTYGSKQNEHIVSRGILGDAMKQIATWPYVLIHTKDDGTAFVDKQWDYPLIVRSNGIERQVLTRVDKANQIIDPNISPPSNHLSHIDTEVESTWPIIEEVRYKLKPEKIWNYCLKYTIFTTDISFKFQLIDNTSTDPVPPKIMKADIPALHSISPKWINKSSVLSYTPEEFTAKFKGVHDKQGITVYDVLRTFVQGTQMKKSPEVDISIAEFIKDPSYGNKLESLYHQLWEIAKSFNKTKDKNKAKKEAKSTKKLSLPYSHISPEERRKALAYRIAQIYPTNNLDVEKAVYRIFHDEVRDGLVQHPFALEIIAIPVSEYLLRANPNDYQTEFIGAVNYSLPPTGNIFEGEYCWKKKKDDTYPAQANDIRDILRVYNFRFYGEYYSKDKLPCVIAANLISPKIYYQGKDKARIDTSPFTHTIIKAVKIIADNIETFKDVGIELPSDYRHLNISKKEPKIPKEDRKTTYDIVEELLLPRIQKVKARERITSVQTQDSLWYNALPLFAKYKLEPPDRSTFKTNIKAVCKDYEVTREQLGIIAAPWASMYFNGLWHDISFNSIQSLAQKGTDIIFIEKRDIVQAIGKYASDWGVAVVNTHGHLSEYTKDLAEIAKTSGAHITILTDYDIPGLVIASSLKNVLWLGVNEKMLKFFGITHDNKERVVPYTPKKRRITEENLQILLKSDERFSSSPKNKTIIDIDFLRNPNRSYGKRVVGEKVEIDAVLAEVGAKRLWNYIKSELGLVYKERNYLRVIDPNPSQSDHYPKIVRKIQIYCKRREEEAKKEESQKIGLELEKVEGFLKVRKKRKEIDKRLGTLVENDPPLKKMATELEKWDKEKGFNINDLIPDEPEPEEPEEEEAEEDEDDDNGEEPEDGKEE